MMECLSLLCEMLAVLIVIHNLLRKKLIIHYKFIVFVLLYVLIFYMVNKSFFPAYMQITAYFFLFLYLKLVFREKSFIGIISIMFCTFFFIGGLQLAIYHFLRLLGFIKEGYLANFVVLVFVIVLTKIFDLGKIYQYIKKINISYLFLGCGILSVILVVEIKRVGSFSILEIILYGAVFMIVIMSCYQWKMQQDIIILKERELSWLAQCNDSFEQLITDVRSRQHEFNSQIDAICGMQYSCTTYDELVEQINLYTAQIIQENQFNKLLTMECPPIIKGFLYYRFCKAYEDDFVIDYQIALKNETDFSTVYDIAEIVGILFDNACEAFKNETCSKHIYVSIKHITSEIQIFVENVSSYIPYQEISLFLKKGYSTKGKMRGYGLYNVKNIAKKYDGEIAINNIERTGENWLQIAVNLPV